MKRPALAIVIAVLLALGAGVVVFVYVSGADNRAMEQQEVATVVVAREAVPEGMSLSQAQAEGLLITETVPARMRPASALGPVDATNGSLVALADLPAGQIILATGVGAEVPMGEAIEVPEGEMAVSVLLDDPSKVGAFLRPGSRVAIFDTYAVETETETADGATDTTTVFQTRPLLDDVMVLAVGAVTRAQADSAESQAWDAQLVTLALTQDQAERLVHATRTGALHFALLGEGTQLTPSEGVTDQNLFE